MERAEVARSSRIHRDCHQAKTQQKPNTQGKQPTGRNVGKLKNLLGVPLDIFFEVCASV